MIVSNRKLVVSVCGVVAACSLAACLGDSQTAMQVDVVEACLQRMEADGEGCCAETDCTIHQDCGFLENAEVGICFDLGTGTPRRMKVEPIPDFPGTYLALENSCPAEWAEPLRWRLHETSLVGTPYDEVLVEAKELNGLLRNGVGKIQDGQITGLVATAATSDGGRHYVCDGWVLAGRIGLMCDDPHEERASCHVTLEQVWP